MKRMLMEVRVTDEADSKSVASLLDDALFWHIDNCANQADERRLFATDQPRVIPVELEVIEG